MEIQFQVQIQYTKATYDRLVKAGAKDVHISLLDKVLDTTGLYKKEDGSPYEYFGHFSWIYVYNNKSIDNINGKTTTIMEWLATKTLKTSDSTGWVKNADGTWSYINTDGGKATGWINDNGTWYYCNESGVMLANTIVGEYLLGDNGAWVK